MKIGVALSGGKDSSLAAALLKRRGDTVVAYHLRLCPDEYALLPPDKQIFTVQGIAAILGIELKIIDFREQFRREIIGDFLKAYQKGLTPNPCVSCNCKFKFGLLLDQAGEDGCVKLASGHYARVEEAGSFILKKASDPERDESYFLCRLTPPQLRRLVFPLGEGTQAEHRELSAGFFPGYSFLPVTQEACFLQRCGLKEFLRENLSPPPRPGDIVNTKGEKLAEHPGYQFYTIGQRKGLGSASGQGGPLFVLRIIPDKNQVIVGAKDALLSPGLVASEPNWLSISPPVAPLQVKAKIRYAHPGAEAKVSSLTDGKVKLEFFKPQEAVTPGQAVVFYRKGVLLGGAWIDQALG